MASARNHPGPRGRKVLLWLAIFFVSGQLASGWAIDQFWPQVRFPHLYERLQRLDGQSTPPTVVCLGSSRIGLALNGQELTHWLRRATGDRQIWAFNAGVPFGDLLSSERVLAEMLKRGVKPRIALIEMSPLAVMERNPGAGLHAERFLKWSELPFHVADVAERGQLLRLFQYKFLPLYGFRWQICQALTGGLDECAAAQGKVFNVDLPDQPADSAADFPKMDAALWDNSAAQQPGDAAAFQASFASPDSLKRDLRNYRPGGNLAAALPRFIQFCDDNGIEPILIGIPLPSPFRDCVTPEMEASYRKFLEQVCRQHHCRFANYYTALADSFFFDYHHATREGGRLLSRKVTADLLVPFLHGENRQR